MHDATFVAVILSKINQRCFKFSNRLKVNFLIYLLFFKCCVKIPSGSLIGCDSRQLSHSQLPEKRYKGQHAYKVQGAF